MFKRDYTHFIIALTMVILVLFLILAIVVVIDEETGTVIDTHEAPGTIVDLYRTSSVQSTQSGKTTIYHTNYNYFAKVLSENEVYTVHITWGAYNSYFEGQDVILFTYTTKGGISGTIYINYAIKVLN